MTKAFCDICLMELNDSNRFHGHKAIFDIHPQASKEKTEARKERLEVTITIGLNGPLGHRDAQICIECLKDKLNNATQDL